MQYEEIKDYLITRGNKLKQIIRQGNDVLVEEITVSSFPQDRVPMFCECGEVYAMDYMNSYLFNIHNVCQCGKKLQIIERGTKELKLLVKGLNNSIPDLDTRDVYNNREEVEKYGYVRRWHEKM